MRLFINSKDEFELWDYLHLNNDIFDINFTEIEIQERDDKDKKKKIKLQTVEVTLQVIKNSDSYKKQRRYVKLLDTLKLFVKNHDKEEE